MEIHTIGILGMSRTAVINQIRGLLLERGITIRKERHHIEVSLTGILEDADNKLWGALRVLLTQLQLQLQMQYLQRRIEESDKLINVRLVNDPRGAVSPSSPSRRTIPLRGLTGYSAVSDFSHN
jgi:hypothetical protein